MADNIIKPPAAPLRAYRVLARKYRPRSFDDLIGQEAMVRTLSNAFETGRLPQAWMLTGVRGVGKTTTARILARALNYQLPGMADHPTIHMPTHGIHCEAIIEGRHLDVMEIDAASHTGIDDIREISDAARYTPMSARYKVYVIDEVHMLSKAAFNGLLKTLEEPPAHVKFIFATTEIRKVPVTILSRCQRFDLRRIDIDVLSAHLHKIASAEAMMLEPDAALLIARAAEGSVRDALSLLDQANASAEEAITAETVRHMLGLADRMRIFDLLDTVMRGNAAAALDLFAAHYRDGVDPAILVSEMAEAVHALARAKIVGIEAGSDAVPQAERERITTLATGLSQATLSRAWQMLLKGSEELKEAPRPASAVEMLLIRLCHVAELPSPEDVVKRLQRGDDTGAPASSRETSPPPAGRGPAAGLAATGAQSENVPSARSEAVSPAMSGPGPAKAATRTTPRLVSQSPAPAAIADPRPVAVVDLLRFEDLVALAHHKRDIRLKTALERSVHLVRFERGRIELRFRDGQAATLVPDMQRKLQEWTGERWLITLSQEQGLPTLEEQANVERQMLVDDVRSHPSVSAILARFPGAEIIDIRMPDAPQPIGAGDAGMTVPDDDNDEGDPWTS